VKLVHRVRDGYWTIGSTTFLEQSIAEAGGAANHFSYLVKAYMLPDLVKHLAVTIPLTIKGMFPLERLSVPGVFLIYTAVSYYFRGRERIVLLLFALPAVIMLGLHALVTVNVSRYNDPLLVIYAAIVVAAVRMLAVRLVARFGKRFRNSPEG
jgi:hypothetical protein